MCRKNLMCSVASLKAIENALRNIAEDKRWACQGDFIGFTNKANHALRGLIASHLIMTLEFQEELQEDTSSETQEEKISKYHVAKNIICSSVKKSLGEIAKDTQPIIFGYLGIENQHEYMKMLTYTAFRKKSDPDAAKELFFDNSELEKKIAEVAGILASYVELKELSYKLPKEYYSKKEREILSSLSKFEADEEMEIAIQVSMRLVPLYVETAANLRSQNRWKLQLAPCNCSVLAHLYDTAVIAFFNTLELTNNKQEAGKCFFMGIYHDLPESGTGDMPSPLKDVVLMEIVQSYFYTRNIIPDEGIESFFEKIKPLSVTEQVKAVEQTVLALEGKIPEGMQNVLNMIKENKTIRSGAEHAEDIFMENEFYTQLPEYMVKPTEKLMFEAVGNEEYFPLIKAADYLAAILECDYQYEKGSNSEYFQRATLSTMKGISDGKYPVGENLLKVFQDLEKNADLLLKSSKNSSEVEQLRKEVEELKKLLAQK